jgi:tRNA A37 threonylcarbamoyladenosine modification protein TsaB
VILSAVEISGDPYTAVVVEVQPTGLAVLSRVEESARGLPLPSLLFDAASAAGRGPRELGMIALGLGPSDPARARLAMTLLRALASVTKAPFVAISAVEALAFQVSDSAPIGAVLVPAIALPDGRVTTATFSVEEGKGPVRVARECSVTPDEWIRMLAETKPSFALGFGTGYAAHRALVQEALPELVGAPGYPSAFGVALAAAPLARGASAKGP